MRITFPNGESREFPEGIRAIDVAKTISERLAKEALGAFFNGEKIDLSRKLFTDGTI
ncbi:MAG: TGS domain-containing protein, partial [Candidatus Kapaibacteriota bacterium]